VPVDPDFYPWLSIAALAWGVLDCFFGYRVFKITLALFGAMLGLWAGHFLSLQLGANPLVETIVMIAGAVAGATLAFLLYIVAVFLAGFGFGATLGMLLLAHYHQMIALLTGLVLGLVGGFLAVKVQRVLIILSTALLGSFRALLALSYFTSHIDWVFYYRQPEQMPALIENNGWMFPAVLALAAVGVITQLELGGNPAGPKSTKEKKQD